MSACIEAPQLPFAVTPLSKKVINVDIKYTGPCWEQWFLLSSDRHHDNAHANHELELKHLKQAIQRRAGILDHGDLFCAMQGRWDKRKDQDQLREELRGNNYLDRLVSYNADFYEPFARNIVMVSPGNHETAISKHHDTNLTERFVEHINAKTGSSIHVGSYTGYVIFRVWFSQTRVGSIKYAWHHGSGGGGPVTKGVIQAQRRAVFLPDADIVYSGHIHEEWEVIHTQERLGRSGETKQVDQTHLCSGGYKDEYSCGDGYHIEGGRPPKPNGGKWLRLYTEPGDESNARIRYDVIRAK